MVYTGWYQYQNLTIKVLVLKLVIGRLQQTLHQLDCDCDNLQIASGRSITYDSIVHVLIRKIDRFIDLLSSRSWSSRYEAIFIDSICQQLTALKVQSSGQTAQNSLFDCVVECNQLNKRFAAYVQK